MMTDPFFGQKRIAAEVKHRILRAYLGAFTGKAGSRSDRGRVFYVDGYAGPGLYDNEDLGSPIIATEVADLLRRSRSLEAYFIEEKQEHASELRRNLEALGARGCHVVEESAARGLPRVLDQANDDPMLVFLDPYGLAPPFDLISSRLMRRRGITEVLLHFSRIGLA